MRLGRVRHQRSPISLVAMIDVLMIMLVFFMVTSTYLDLDMVPLAEGADGEAAPVAAGGAAPPQGRLLVRLAADGQAYVQGRAQSGDSLAALIGARLAVDPALEVIVLPSGLAEVQALAALMDVSVAAGAGRLRVVRLEASP